jgi:hypothetical protein
VVGPAAADFWPVEERGVVYHTNAGVNQDWEYLSVILNMKVLLASTKKWNALIEAPFFRGAHAGTSYARNMIAEADQIRIMGMRLPRLFSLIPLVVYGVGILTILAGSMLGTWQLTFHPDALFPYELTGLSACALTFWLG